MQMLLNGFACQNVPPICGRGGAEEGAFTIIFGRFVFLYVERYCSMAAFAVETRNPVGSLRFYLKRC